MTNPLPTRGMRTKTNRKKRKPGKPGKNSYITAR